MRIWWPVGAVGSVGGDDADHVAGRHHDDDYDYIHFARADRLERDWNDCRRVSGIQSSAAGSDHCIDEDNIKNGLRSLSVGLWCLFKDQRPKTKDLKAVDFKKRESSITENFSSRNAGDGARQCSFA